MAKLSLKRTLPFILAIAIPFTMSGCSKRSDCEVPSRHLHLYINEKGISKYVDCENEYYYDYKWYPDYIEITKDDEAFYNAYQGLFNGEENWNYLYKQMKSHKDFLEYYYEYTTIETYTTTDDKGNTHTHTRTVHHSGWHDDQKSSNNTGKVRLGHHKYYGYNIVYKNGKYQRVKSSLVDDIRDIIEDYPYYNEEPVEVVYKEYKFKKKDLKDLKVSDFEGEFGHPRLDTKDIKIEVENQAKEDTTETTLSEFNGTTNNNEEQNTETYFAPANNTNNEVAIGTFTPNNDSGDKLNRLLDDAKNTNIIDSYLEDLWYEFKEPFEDIKRLFK